MKEIMTVRGDITQSPDDLIIHGCNSQGVMGSGVAKAIREKWPKAYADYREHYEVHGNILLPGAVIFSEVEDGRYIGNCITQNHYGNDGKRYVSYSAVKFAFMRVNDFCESKDIKTLSMPKIGAGLGGGDWDIIYGLAINHLKYPKVTIYEF